jgi:hypothetical protein
MHKFGKIIQQINRRTNMEQEIFECTFKKAFEKDDGQVTVYVTKDNGTDMTVYAEVTGSLRWQKGDRLKIAAQAVKTSKTGKQYQTASNIENLNSGSAPSTNMISASGVQSNRDGTTQWSEKYRLTMSNLISSYISGGKMPTDTEYQKIDNYVRKILDAKANSIDDILSDDAPF